MGALGKLSSCEVITNGNCTARANGTVKGYANGTGKCYVNGYANGNANCAQHHKFYKPLFGQLGLEYIN